MKLKIRKPTIKDVAQKSNVSVATVSRILNHLDGYTEDTRKKVTNIVNEMGYRRNAIARNLKVKETHTIGVLLPMVDTSFYIKILNGIQDFAHLNNYSVIICNVGNDGKRMSEYLRVLSERQVDGIIVCSLPTEEDFGKKIIECDIPSILVSTLSYGFDLPYIKVDDYKASYAATCYLIENGHKQIAMIGGNKEEPIAGVSRLNGYIQALKDNNIPIRENFIKHNGYSFKDGIISMNELLNENEKFTAIFATSDDIAVGALSVAHEKGIRVPEDISIIGYDNTKVSEMSYPALTTVGQPLYEMGRKSIEMLVNNITLNEKFKSIIMPFEIIERETVKKIN